eukprot:s235_g18.t1
MTPQVIYTVGVQLQSSSVPSCWIFGPAMLTKSAATCHDALWVDQFVTGFPAGSVLNFIAMNLDTFSLSSKDKETPLYMYCTGGIRCEYFGAALRRQGFKHVYKLKGGIQHYGNTIGSEGWKGRLFVFDRRNSVPVGEGAAKLQHCSMCGKSNAAEEFWNCANVDCNRCMVTCRSCLLSAKGCCCKDCREATSFGVPHGASLLNARTPQAPTEGDLEGRRWSIECNAGQRAKNYEYWKKYRIIIDNLI